MGSLEGAFSPILPISPRILSKSHPGFQEAQKAPQIFLRLLVVSLGDCRDSSVSDISKTSKEVVERAQSGVMREEDYIGSTFSISNMGMFDVDSFSAIIYPPQAAVLAVGTVRKQPVVRDDQITIAQVMKATLSTDHRVADGAQAAQFLVEVKRVLENPVTLLL